MDVTVVGSGPNGLSAAVVCARAGLKVQVLESQPTLGGGSRTLTDPEFTGVRHDICSAIHPLALASPFFAEFDLRARGVALAVPEISYANPLTGTPAAIASYSASASSFLPAVTRADAAPRRAASDVGSSSRIRRLTSSWASTSSSC